MFTDCIALVRENEHKKLYDIYQYLPAKPINTYYNYLNHENLSNVTNEDNILFFCYDYITQLEDNTILIGKRYHSSNYIELFTTKKFKQIECVVGSLINICGLDFNGVVWISESFTRYESKLEINFYMINIKENIERIIYKPNIIMAISNNSNTIYEYLINSKCITILNNCVDAVYIKGSLYVIKKNGILYRYYGAGYKKKILSKVIKFSRYSSNDKILILRENKHHKILENNKLRNCNIKQNISDVFINGNGTILFSTNENHLMRCYTPKKSFFNSYVKAEYILDANKNRIQLVSNLNFNIKNSRSSKY